MNINDSKAEVKDAEKDLAAASAVEAAMDDTSEAYRRNSVSAFGNYCCASITVLLSHHFSLHGLTRQPGKQDMAMIRSFENIRNHQRELFKLHMDLEDEYVPDCIHVHKRTPMLYSFRRKRLSFSFTFLEPPEKARDYTSQHFCDHFSEAFSVKQKKIKSLHSSVRTLLS